MSRNKIIVSLFFLLFFICSCQKHGKNKSRKAFKDPLLDFKFNNESMKIEQLNDFNIDNFVKNGVNNRWIITFYMSTCGHCRRARTVLRTLLKENQHNKTYHQIKFGELDIDKNQMSTVRFNAEGVPYIILVENSTLFELRLFPNKENLVDFIFTNLSAVNKTELLSFPGRISFFKVANAMFLRLLKGINQNLNSFLKGKGFKVEIPVWGMVLMFGGGVVLSIYLEYLLLSRCCFQEDFEKELKKLEENLKKEQEEKRLENEGEQVEESEEIEDENNIIDKIEGDNEEKKDINEALRKEKEEVKVKEHTIKEKGGKIDNKDNKDNKAHKNTKEKQE